MVRAFPVNRQTFTATKYALSPVSGAGGGMPVESEYDQRDREEAAKRVGGTWGMGAGRATLERTASGGRALS